MSTGHRCGTGPCRCGEGGKPCRPPVCLPVSQPTCVSPCMLYIAWHANGYSSTCGVAIALLACMPVPCMPKPALCAQACLTFSSLPYVSKPDPSLPCIPKPALCAPPLPCMCLLQLYEAVRRAAPWADIIPPGATFSVEPRLWSCTDLNNTHLVWARIKDAVCAVCSVIPYIGRRKLHQSYALSLFLSYKVM